MNFGLPHHCPSLQAYSLISGWNSGLGWQGYTSEAGPTFPLQPTPIIPTLYINNQIEFHHFGRLRDKDEHLIRIKRWLSLSYYRASLIWCHRHEVIFLYRGHCACGLNIRKQWFDSTAAFFTPGDDGGPVIIDGRPRPWLSAMVRHPP